MRKMKLGVAYLLILVLILGSGFGNIAYGASNSDSVNEKVEDSTDNAEDSTDNAEDSTDNVEDSTDNAEDSTDNAEDSTDSVKDSTDNAEDSTDNAEDSTDSTEDSSDSTEDSSDSAEEPVETPEEPVETPEEPVETPEEPVETPEEPVETPEEPVETPEEPVETPEEPVGTPEEPVETPEEPAETPEEPVETPEEPVETPEEPAETPEEPVETPEEAAETPEEPVETPEEPDETPEEPVELPEEPVIPPEEVIPPELPLEPIVPEVIPEPSLYVSVETDRDAYKFWEPIEYTINIINNGNVDITDIGVEDDLTGVDDFIELLPVGEERSIHTNYQVLSEKGIENKMLVNKVYITAVSEEIILNEEETSIVQLKGPDKIHEECDSDFIEKQMYEKIPEEYLEKLGVIKRISSKRMARSLMAKSLDSIVTNYTDTIVVDKRANEVEGCREYEVKLDITGTPPETPLDVVLVIDRSGSMKSGSPSSMDYAKDAAKEFTEKVLNNNPNNRVAVVSFEYVGEYHDFLFWGWWDDGNLYDDTSINSNFSNNLSSLKGAINSIVANGGTNTEAGFIRASNLMSSYGRPEANKAIVLLTDGVPTVSIGREYGPSNPDNHNSHTIAAYEAGRNAQFGGDVQVFTVGLLGEVPSNSLDIARDTLDRAQNAGYYETDSAVDLSDIYENIAGQLGYSAKDAEVIDVINDNFVLLSDFSENDDVSYDEDTRTIRWTPGTIINESSLTYRLRAKCSFQGGESIPTNDWAKLDYNDVNGNHSTKDFPIPNVNVQPPLSVDLGEDKEIIIEDIIGLGDNLTVTSGYPPYTYTWSSSNDPEWISHDMNPQVSPRDDTTYTLTVNDKYGSEVCGACTDTDEIAIKVIKGSITINKVVKNESTNRKFVIWIYGPDGKRWAKSIRDGDSVTLGYLRPGNYQIKEVVPMNYKLVGISANAVNITANSLDKNITVTNKRSNDSWFYDEDEAINSFTVNMFNGENTTKDTNKDIALYFKEPLPQIVQEKKIAVALV
ncbi:vWA domain-containing protein [Clostridiisalibacter paucivorans]|uniref:vWA domain-containing protein n=1 Tax=Clostridiisalibacter paucivorans TaxID=408753 RepID=UPI000552DD08|nr:vWA domain-containing protein [Clostridiisalibacter paucivorans]